MSHKNITYSILLIVVCWLLSDSTQRTVHAIQHAHKLEGKASIQGYVWLDENENGQRSTEENGVDNIMIKLYDMENQPHGTTLTDESGSFSFDGLASGDYRLEVIKPFHYEFTTSDVDPATGETTTQAVENPDEQSMVVVGLMEQPLDPTPIELSEFEVGIDQNGEGIAIWWVTGAEIDTRGFHIYRSTTTDRNNAAEITGGLIPSQTPDSENKRRYLYIDGQAVDTGIQYSYWLQEVEIDNVTNDYGPKHMSGIIAVDTTTVEPSIPIPYRRVYLPLVVR